MGAAVGAAVGASVGAAAVGAAVGADVAVFSLSLSSAYAEGPLLKSRISLRAVMQGAGSRGTLSTNDPLRLRNFCSDKQKSMTSCESPNSAKPLA